MDEKRSDYRSRGDRDDDRKRSNYKKRPRQFPKKSERGRPYRPTRHTTNVAGNEESQDEDFDDEDEEDDDADNEDLEAEALNADEGSYYVTIPAGPRTTEIVDGTRTTMRTPSGVKWTTCVRHMPRAGRPKASPPSSDWAEDIEEVEDLDLEARAVARARRGRHVLWTTGPLMSESATAAAALASRRVTGTETRSVRTCVPNWTFMVGGWDLVQNYDNPSGSESSSSEEDELAAAALALAAAPAGEAPLRPKKKTFKVALKTVLEALAAETDDDEMQKRLKKKIKLPGKQLSDSEGSADAAGVPWTRK